MDLKRAIVTCSGLLLYTVAALASVTGSISGIVTDPSGAVIPKAAVIVHNTETGIKHMTYTNDQGFYSFPTLSVGRYSIEIQAKGFKDYRQTDAVLDVNNALRVDIKLQLGDATEQVTISAAAVQVETANTQMGEVIGSAKITTVPLNGRSYTDLLALQPGVAPVSSGEYSSPSVSGSLNSGNVSVSGQRESANGFMVNGGNVQEGVSMGTSIIPNLDSIEEFRIITNNFDAEYGNYSGGQVNAITKSGKNALHGDLFEFLRNTSLNARNFFSPTRSTFIQSQFGGTVGGPILRNRIFFFTDYQGTRSIIGQAQGPFPVPSLANRNGNVLDVFTGIFANLPQGATPPTVAGASGPGSWASVLTQRLGYTVNGGEPYWRPGCTTSSQCVFPNGIIPPSAFSAPANGLLKFIPTPDPGRSDFSTSAFNATLRDGKGSIRIDANTGWGAIAGYYFLDHYTLQNPYPSATVPGFSGINTGRAQMVNISDTKILGTTAVNELRIHFIRASPSTLPSGGLGVKLSSLGFTTGAGSLGIVSASPQFEGVPSVAFNNFTIGIPAFFAHQFNNTYQVLDNFTKAAGKHIVKLGASFHYDQINQLSFGANQGQFSFNGSETGSDFVDFLLGAPTSYVQGVQAPIHTRTRYFGVYGQDSFRVRPSLTINYGLRWEFSTPWYETQNELETLVPGLQSRVFPGAPKGWVFPGDPGVPRTLSPTRYNNFSPRLGVAYSPGIQDGVWGKLFGGPGKTSIRSGFGIFFTAFEDLTSFNEIGDPPYGLFWVSPQAPLFDTPFIDRVTGNSEGQRFPVIFPRSDVSAQSPDNTVNWSQYLPISSSPGFSPANRLPYSEHYNLSVQRQFGSATLLGISYVGTQGHRLLAAVESNPSNPALCLSANQPNQVQRGSSTCGPMAETGSFTLLSGQAVVPRKPFGASFGSNALFSTVANSSYNALEVTMRHVTGRAEFLVGYTYSKVLDNASGWGGSGDIINPVNPRLGRKLAAFDLTHNFVASYSFHLPFDRIFHPGRLTSGWVLSGITRFATGLPVFLTENDDNSLLGTFFSGPTGTGIDGPNFTPGSLNFTDPRKATLPTQSNPGVNPYFNTSLFSKEALGQLGNSSRRFFHGPGFNNFDMALLKDLRITESKTIQFRAEFFNVFNHAQFTNPSGEINSSTFGFVTGARDPRIGQLAIKFLF